MVRFGGEGHVPVPRSDRGATLLRKRRGIVRRSWKKIFTWYSTQHAYLLGQLAQIDVGGHSLLDETVVFFGSHLQSPANYSKKSMPFLLAGGGGGLRGGRYLKHSHRSHNDLLSGICNLCGDPANDVRGSPLLHHSHREPNMSRATHSVGYFSPFSGLVAVGRAGTMNS